MSWTSRLLPEKAYQENHERSRQLPRFHGQCVCKAHPPLQLCPGMRKQKRHDDNGGGGGVGIGGYTNNGGGGGDRGKHRQQSVTAVPIASV